MLGAALCVSCAMVVGLEDKQPYPIDVSETGTENDAQGTVDGPIDPAQPDGSDAGSPEGGEIIVVNQTAPYGIVVDEAFVYWTSEGDGGANTGQVMRRAKSLAAGPEVLVVDQLQPQHMLIDNSYVYWSNNNSPKKTLLDGSPDVPVLLRASRLGGAAQEPTIIARAQDQDRATKRISCWNGIVPNSDGGADVYLFAAQKDQTRRFLRQGGAGGAISQLPGNNHDYATVATDESYAYFLDQTTNTVFRRVKVFDGGLPQEAIGTTPNGILMIDMGVDATNVYLVSQGGQVYVVPKVPAAGAAAVTTLGAAVGATAKAMIVTDKELFITRWTAGTDGELVMMKKDGTPKLLSTGLGEPNEMFVDVENTKRTIYWTNRSDGSIRRLILE